MSVSINGTSGVTTPGITNSEGYTGDGLTIAANAPAGALQIDTSGNLGLGVVPTYKFDISGADNSSFINLRPTTIGGTSTYVGIRFASGDAAGTLPNRNSQIRGFNDGAADTQGLSFWTAFGAAPTERMRLDSSGNLLVGTTSNPNNSRVYARYDGVSAQPVINSASTTAASTSWNHFIGQSGNGSSITTNNIFILGNGNVQNANNSYGAFSDSKLKENIVDATPKLNKLCQVRVVNYNLIGDYEKHRQIGVIAQELEQIFPSMVEEAPDRDAEGNDLGTTTKSVKYSVFVPMLIKAIQEQQAMITELKARIEQLEAK